MSLLPQIHEVISSGGAAPESRGGQEGAPHILLVVDQFPRALGGGERVLLRMAAALPGLGFRVSILTFQIAPESEIYRLPVPCPVFLLPLTRTWDLHAARAAWALARWIRRERVGLVQTFFESSDLWAGMVTRLLTPARLVWNRRDMGILRGRKHRILYRLMRRAPDLVFAVSEQVRRFTLETDGVPAGRVVTLYNGVDVDAWPTCARELPGDGAFVVAAVGNLRPVKGQDVLIRAFAQVHREFPRATLQIAGEILDQAYGQELQRLIQECGLEGAVEMAGPVSDVAAFLAGADLFVLPSRSEGFSNAILEGMAAGKAVVATMVGGNAEAVSDGVTGLLVPPDDSAALAAAMLQLLRAPGLLHSMGVEGRKRLREKFSQQAVFAEFASSLKEVLKKRK